MKRKAHSIDVIFMLVLFSIFAIMSVLLILIGSNVYGKILSSQEVSGNNRNMLAYITNKVRACQIEDGVFIEEKDGTQVLGILSADGDVVYETLIYEDNGKLKEATIEAGDEYTLDFGDVLAEVSDFEVKLDVATGVLNVMVETDGEKRDVDVYAGGR